MSATEEIADVPVSEATHNVAAEINEHTPETPAPVDTVTDPTETDDGLEVLRGMVTALATAVATLTNTVAGLAPKDVSPVNSVPWTHRGGHHDLHGKDDD